MYEPSIGPRFFLSACLPDQLQSEPHRARCGRCGGEDARRRNWGSVGSKQAGIVSRYHRRRKIRVIQHVEEFELGIAEESLVSRQCCERAGVFRVENAWTDKNISAPASPNRVLGLGKSKTLRFDASGADFLDSQLSRCTLSGQYIRPVEKLIALHS